MRVNLIFDLIWTLVLNFCASESDFFFIFVLITIPIRFSILIFIFLSIVYSDFRF